MTIRFLSWGLLVLLAPACATLNTAGMSDSCQRLYNACLDGCPRANTPPDGSLAQTTWRTDVAACTDQCNQQAKHCQ